MMSSRGWARWGNVQRGGSKWDLIREADSPVCLGKEKGKVRVEARQYSGLGGDREMQV